MVTPSQRASSPTDHTSGQSSLRSRRRPTVRCSDVRDVARKPQGSVDEGGHSSGDARANQGVAGCSRSVTKRPV
jgi:hypothetical protein